jgi:hypothetical protein
MLQHHDLMRKNLIPLDKSWMMRVGVLDIIHGYSDIIFFLEDQFELSDDLAALLRAAQAWGTEDEIDVGESGTLYRFLQFTSWKLGLPKTFIKYGTLLTRKISNDPSIVNLPLKELLLLDNGTSQWASAAVLLGNEEQIENPPYKLALTYEARSHWLKQRAEGNPWLPQHDETILKQADAFIRLLRGEAMSFFTPQQSEDYCFAHAFNLITKEEGIARWPSLQTHETNRIEEMEKELQELQNTGTISSKDHRVVQALALLASASKKPFTVLHKDAVEKTWPQFWRFLDEAVA